MSGRRSWLAVVVLSLFAGLGAWRVGSQAMADLALQPTPSLAMRPDGRSPAAVDALPGRDEASAASEGAARARARLEREPIDSSAFAALAEAEAPRHREALYRIAVRRAPRSVATRVWLANRALQARRFDEAMWHIDVLLRLTPPYREHLYPRMARLSANPAFAAALANTLRAGPGWRAEFIGTLYAADANRVREPLMSYLAGRGALQPDEVDRWIDRLLAAGQWLEAYGLWVHSASPYAARLPAVYNGTFATPPSGRGFDWRLMHAAGVRLDFLSVPGSRGLAAHVEFPGRPAAGAGLEHPLLLGPGRYRLTTRTRASALQANTGLRWELSCGDRASAIAHGQSIRGTFDWREMALDFAVPAAGCEGQWLQLLNPAPAGAPQVVSGELWFDEVVIRALGPHSRPHVGKLGPSLTPVLHSTGGDWTRIEPGASLAIGDRLVARQATVAYRSGCVDPVRSGAVYQIDEAACGRVRTGPVAYPEPPDIAVLPQAEAWPLPPIGR